MKDRLKQEDCEEDTVIEGKDAQRAADIKVAGTVSIVTGVEEDAGNQKAGEDKEDVYTRPTPRDGVVVLKEHHEECDGAETVKRGIKGTIFGHRAFGVAGDGQAGGHQRDLRFRRLVLWVPLHRLARILTFLNGGSS
jgi:hypothetical protein